MARRIVRNAARCKTCGDVIESRHVHDFKHCSCKSIFVDGGHEYLRRGWSGFSSIEDALEELSEYDAEPQDKADEPAP